MEKGKGTGGSSDGKKNAYMGEKHPDTLRSMEALVIIYKWLGQRNEAKALKEKISIY